MSRESRCDERDNALGPGIVRLPNAAYLRPLQSQVLARCLGPLAFFKVTSKFAFSGILEGDDELVFLYPLPAEASLISFTLEGEKLLPGKLEVKSVTDLPDTVERPIPSDGMLSDFQDETLCVFSLRLDQWRSQIEQGKPFTVDLEYAAGLPTVDGRIKLTCPPACLPLCAPRGRLRFSSES